MLFFSQVFYFMQPDTTPLTLARDITAVLSGQASSEQTQNTEDQEDGPAQTQPTADGSMSALTSGNQVQVVPLYTPAGSAIKFFCVHPSHRYALNLVPISTGFQGQVFPECYIGVSRCLNPYGGGKPGHIVAHDVSWVGKRTGNKTTVLLPCCAKREYLLRTQNVSERNQKHFLCFGHKFCVHNKCYARKQTGKHLCPQQCVLTCNIHILLSGLYASGIVLVWGI